MLFADLLSLHLVTFLMFFILVANGIDGKELADGESDYVHPWAQQDLYLTCHYPQEVYRV